MKVEYKYLKYILFLKINFIRLGIIYINLKWKLLLFKLINKILSF